MEMTAIIPTFENTEHCHLELLLYLQNVKNYFYSKKVFLGLEAIPSEAVEEAFYAVPIEILNRCGYQRNKSSFGRAESLAFNVLKGEIKELATLTEFKDLPAVKGLEFLSVKSDPVTAASVKTVKDLRSKLKELFDKSADILDDLFFDLIQDAIYGNDDELISFIEDYQESTLAYYGWEKEDMRQYR